MDNITNSPISLSDCGQYFSYCTLDGQLKIWDTLSGQLKQEYTPSSHLSATCVRIVWPFKPMPSIVCQLLSINILIYQYFIVHFSVLFCFLTEIYFILNKGFAEKETKT